MLRNHITANTILTNFFLKQYERYKTFTNECHLVMLHKCIQDMNSWGCINF